jgi:signal peptidase I
MSSDRSRPSAEQVLAALNTPAAPARRVTEAPGTARPRTDPAATAAPARPAPARPQEEGGIKETIESILVAFVLAFIFRAFVVEAFVIPTGSMAPTLLGAHMRFTCTDCGYDFDVNYTGRTIGDDVEIPSVAQNKVYSVYCPNCGLKVQRQNEQKPDDVNDATAPPVHYGDRILVLKYAYLLSRPQRWDVVVFKTPDRSDDERRQIVPPYTVNYIKRLIGRPGESVYILDGDIYAAPSGTPVDRHEVQRKPRAAQEALWRVVSDNDYQPGRKDWRNPWVEASADSGWAVAREMKFDNRSGGGWLRFDPGTGGEEPGNQPLTDWLAYAATKHPGSGESYDHRDLVGRNNVSDLKLSLFYQRHAGDGPLRLQLTKLDTVFTAELAHGKVRLLMGPGDGGTPREIGTSDLPVTARPQHVEFMNVDYQVTVRVDGRELVRTSPDQYKPDVEALLSAYMRNQTLPRAQVRVGAEGQSCTLSHVSLWRDVYYNNRRQDDYETDVRWGTPARPMQLGEGEYWVLGDNSLMSGDGRYWGLPVELPEEGLTRVQPGVVPERFVLGKAFFVYWPAGYRLSPRTPGFVPNFGDMRFIH